MKFYFSIATSTYVWKLVRCIVRCFYLFDLQITLSEHVVLLTSAIMLAPHVSWCPILWSYYYYFIRLLQVLNEMPYVRFIAQHLAFKWSWSFFSFPCHNLLILKMGACWVLLGSLILMGQSLGQQMAVSLSGKGKWCWRSPQAAVLKRLTLRAHVPS